VQTGLRVLPLCVCVCGGGGEGGRERETACKSKSNFHTLIQFLICLRDNRFCGVVQECTNPGCPMRVNFVQWRRMFARPHYETIFMSPIWHPEI